MTPTDLLENLEIELAAAHGALMACQIRRAVKHTLKANALAIELENHLNGLTPPRIEVTRASDD